jgi:hypothetical protein
MMSTHGYGAFYRFLLGSVTAKVLHEIQCPVWTGAHLEEAPAREFSIRRVLCSYTPHTYPVALLMMLVSMLCWGSWANTQKIDKIMAIRALLLGLHVGAAGVRASVRSYPGPDESGGFGKFLPQSRQRKRSLFG